MDSDPSYLLGLLGGALVLIAFFSTARTAWQTLPPAAILGWRASSACGQRLRYALYRRRALLRATCAVGSLTAWYAAAALGFWAAAGRWGPGWGLLMTLAGLGLVGLPLFVLLPQRWALRRPEPATLLTAPPLAALLILMLPVVFPLLHLSRLLLRLGGLPVGELDPPVTEEELKALLAQSEGNGDLSEPQRQMLYGVLDFADQTVAQVMTPRPDIISVAADRPLREALRLALEHHHRRLPVYGKNDDDILGVLHVKDLLPYVRSAELGRPARVAARSACYVPETLPASELLRRLQQTRQSIAIVRDEFGGTAGLVTIEDLLEAIVGPIRDEDDQGEEAEILRVAEGELICDGLVSLHPLENLLQEELPEDEYDTLAGFVLDLAGHIPQQGERFVWGDLVFVAERVSGARLERVRIIPAPAPPLGKPAPPA